MKDDNREDCDPPPEPLPLDIDVENTSLWNLMEIFEKQIPDHRKEAILVFGNSGSEQTTVASIVTQTLEKFTVYEDEQKNLVIRDNTGVIGSSSFIPGLFKEKKTNISIIDFPPFDSSRPPKLDITIKYLMREAVSNLPSFKIVLVIPELSLSSKGPMDDFDNLLTSICEMIPNLHQHNRSVGLVVTKVAESAETKQTRSDSEVFIEVTRFLKKYISKTQQDTSVTDTNLSRRKMSRKMNGKFKGLTPPPPHSRKQHRRQFGTEESADSGIATSEKKLKLAKIFLQKNRVAFLRTPNECGLYSEFGASSKDKKSMSDLMKRLKRIPNDNKELFHFKVNEDPETNLEIKNTYMDVNSNITVLLKDLVNYIGKTQYEVTTIMHDFFVMKNWIVSDFDMFSNVTEHLSNSSVEVTPEMLGKEMYLAMSSRGYDTTLGVKFQFRLRKITNQLDFFQSISTDHDSSLLDPEKWVEPLANWLTHESKPRKEFYVFLNNLRNAVSSLEFQRAKSSVKTIPRDIDEVKTMLGNQGQIVTDIVKQFFHSGKDGISKLILKEIIEESLQMQNHDCGGPFAIFKGTIIRSAEFVDSSGKFVCPGSTIPPKFIILATRMVIIDNDVVPAKSRDWENEFAITTPEISVLGNRVIDLSGVPGGSGTNGRSSSTSTDERLRHGLFRPTNSVPKLLVPQSASPIKIALKKRNQHKSTQNLVRWDLNDEEIKLPHQRKKRDSQGLKKRPVRIIMNVFCSSAYDKRGQAGKDGSPGLPGYPGGNFIGLVLNYTISIALVINAAGGSGGAGGRGGNGISDGEKGETLPLIDFLEIEEAFEEYPFPEPGECQTHNHQCMQYNFSKKWDDCWNHEGKIFCYADTCDGGVGGAGGDGGAGGLGGVAGDLVNVSANNSAKQHPGDGESGKNGPGGYGSLGGQSGAGWRYKPDFSVRRWVRDPENMWITSHRNTPGAEGKTGRNKKGLQHPIARHKRFSIVSSEVYMIYRNLYFSTKIPPFSTFFPQDSFFEVVDSSPDVARTFTVEMFFEELMPLERENILLKSRENETSETIALQLTPRFKSLVTRMDLYVKIVSKSLDPAAKKFLSLMYAAAYNELRILSQVTGVAVTVDVENFLEAADLRVKKFQSIKRSADKQKLIEEERTRYKEAFEQKIKDCMEFISTVVDPLLAESQAELARANEELNQAIEAAISQAEQEKADLEEAQRIAEKNAQTKAACGFFKVLGSVASIFGPVGAAIGGAVGAVANVAESIALEPEKQVKPPTPLDPSITKAANLMESQYKKDEPGKAQKRSIFIAEARNALRKHDGSLRKIVGSAEVDNLTHAIDQFESDSNSLKQDTDSLSLNEFQATSNRLDSKRKEILQTINSFVEKIQVSKEIL